METWRHKAIGSESSMSEYDSQLQYFGIDKRHGEWRFCCFIEEDRAYEEEDSDIDDNSYRVELS